MGNASFALVFRHASQDPLSAEMQRPICIPCGDVTSVKIWVLPWRLEGDWGEPGDLDF